MDIAHEVIVHTFWRIRRKLAPWPWSWLWVSAGGRVGQWTLLHLEVTCKITFKTINALKYVKNICQKYWKPKSLMNYDKNSELSQHNFMVYFEALFGSRRIIFGMQINGLKPDLFFVWLSNQLLLPPMLFVINVCSHIICIDYFYIYCIEYSFK